MWRVFQHVRVEITAYLLFYAELTIYFKCDQPVCLIVINSKKEEQD